MQTVLAGLLFIAALFYIGRMIFRSLAPKKDGCASGCGKCAANFDNPDLKNN